MDIGSAGRGRMRASDADREQAIDVLKAAFVQGRLTKDELYARAGRALAARTCADLAALTADIPAGPPGPPLRPLTGGLAWHLARTAISGVPTAKSGLADGFSFVG